MTYVKLISVVVLLLCLSPIVSADNWFNATLGEQFEDAEEGGMMLLLGVVAIYLIASFIMILYGHFAHEQTWFKRGITAIIVFIIAVILYAFAISFFDYYVAKYW